MKRIKMLAVLFSLLFLGIGMLLLDAWDMQHAQAAPRPDAWLAAAPLPEPMAGATIQCPDQPDIIYMVGGVDGHGTSNKLYKYDATTNTWDTTLLNLPIPLRGHAVACYQGRIYVAGGLLNAMNRLFIYNIIGDVWSEGANLPDDTGGASLGAWDGKLYLMGGSPLQATPYTPVSHVDIYDIASNTWEAEGGIPLPTPTAYAYSGVQRGRYYFITGGNSGDPNNNVNQTQRYDMANNDWEVGPEFTSARGINAGSTTATNLYVQGGDVNGGGYFDPTDLVETLDLSAWPAGEWIDLEDPLPQVSMVTAGGCTEARTGGETWAIGGADMNLIPFAEVYFRPAEPCFDFYFGDLAREEMQLGNQPGATAHYVLPVINDGSEVDSYDISVSSGWVVSASLTVGPVVPGDAGLVYVDIEVPEDATPGDFDVATVTLTSQADSSASDNARLTTTVTNWHEAASVPEDIAFHERAQCASDPNGFYVLGGSTPDLWALDEVFYYSANINEWTPVTNLPRGGGWGHLATCYDNKLYVIGSGFSYYVDVFDLTSKTWTYGVSRAPRDPYSSGVGVWNGELFMVGGTNAVNIYNITGKTWRIGPTMPSEISGFGYVQAGQYLYVVGGMMGDWYDWNDNSSYTLRLNLATEEWEEGPTFTSRRAVTDLSVTQGHLYAIGGDINGGERTDPTGQVEVLDLSLWPGGSWEDLQQPTPWALEANWGGPCTEAWSGGEIWSVGGASGIWLQNGMWNWTTIDGAYYLSIGEPCVQNIVNLSDAPMYGEAESGSIVTYTVDITNTGNIVDYYNLTYSSEWPAYKVLGGPGPVGPGETIQVVIEIDVPPDAKPGDIGLTNVRVESLRDPSVMDTIQIYTTVLTTHRVSLIPGDMEDFGIYGEVIPYTLTVTNQGNITDTYVLTFTSAAWEVVLPVGELELGAGESADIVVLVTIPLDVQLGASDVLILTATCMAKPEVTDSATLTTTAFWYRMLLPLEMKH